MDSIRQTFGRATALVKVGVVAAIVTCGMGVFAAAPAGAASPLTIAPGFAAYSPGGSANNFNVLTLASGGTPAASTLSITSQPASGTATASTSTGIITYTPGASTSGNQTVTFQLCTAPSTNCGTGTLTYADATNETFGGVVNVSIDGISETEDIENSLGISIEAPSAPQQGSTVTATLAAASQDIPASETEDGFAATINYVSGVAAIMPVPAGLTIVSGSIKLSGGDATTKSAAIVKYCVTSGTGCTASSGGSFHTTTPYIEVSTGTTQLSPGVITLPTVTAQFTVTGAVGSTITATVSEFDLNINVTLSSLNITFSVPFDGYPAATCSCSSAPTYQAQPLYTATIAAPSPPGAPTIGTATAGTDSATVTWTAGGGGTPTSWVITPYIGTTAQTAVTDSKATDSSYTVTGLTPGTAYTFTVAGANVAGTGAASAASNAVTPTAVVIPAPGAPTITGATAGDTTATLTWTAPTTGGAVTGYIVTPYVGTTAGTAITLGNVLTDTVTGLTDGTTYTFTVTATGGGGPGPASAASNPVTPSTVTTVPGPPVSVTASAIDSGAVLTWGAPTTGGGAIIDYVVTTYVGSTQKGQTTVPITSPLGATIVGLTDGTTYTFAVQAVNAVGAGNSSAISEAVTPATVSTVPGTPTIGAASAGVDSALVNWTPPTDIGGHLLTGYVITPYIGSTAQTPVTVTGGSLTSTSVTGLTPGTPYTFEVAATNSVGTGADSAFSAAVTPLGTATVPGAPTIGTATAGNGQATVSWTAPVSDGGDVIFSYVVTPYQGTTALSSITVGTGTTTVVSGLTNGQAYTFTVAAVNVIGTGTASAHSSAVTPTAVDTAPGAPTIGTAVAGAGQATVNWTDPTSDGGESITGYSITPYIGTSAQTPVTVTGGALTSDVVTGLTDGTAYTFTVAATNGVGTGSASAQSNSVTPTAPGPYTAISPVRICDTRAGNPSGLSGDAAQCNGTGGAGERLAAGTPLTVDVAGDFTVPADATAVVLNVTAINTSAVGYVSVYPAGSPVPTASSLNTRVGQSVANLIETGVGTSGQVSVVSNTAVDLAIDLEGYVTPTSLGGAGLYNPLATPARICDTRAGNPSGLTGGAAQCAGTADAGTRLAAGGVLNVTVDGNGGVPSTGVSAVVLNVTAVGPAAAGYLKVYPEGTTASAASNLNYGAGETLPNRVIVPVSASGQISVTANVATDVLVDVSGWYSAAGGTTGSQFTPEAAPVRLCDTRSGNPSNLSGAEAQCNGTGNAGDPIGTGHTLTVNVAGLAGIPSGATAVVLNVIAIQPSAQTHLTVYPGGTLPTVSDLNPAGGAIESNLVVATVSNTGTVSIYNFTGSVNVAVDAEGWYSS